MMKIHKITYLNIIVRSIHRSGCVILMKMMNMRNVKMFLDMNVYIYIYCMYIYVQFDLCKINVERVRKKKLNRNVNMKFLDNQRFKSYGIASIRRATLRISKVQTKVKVNGSLKIDDKRYLPSGFLMFISPELWEWSSWSESASHQDTFTGVHHTHSITRLKCHLYILYIRMSICLGQI